MKREELNRLVFLLLDTPAGGKFMGWLDAYTGGRLLKKDTGGTVDPLGMAYAAGQRDLVDEIKQRIEDGKLAR